MPNPPVIEVKKGVDAWVPVILLDATDGYTAETGIAAGTAATAYYCAAGATSWNTYTIATGDWREAGLGAYWLNIGASEFAAEGRSLLKVLASGCRAWDAIVEVRDRTQAEVIDLVDALGVGVTVGSGGIGTTAFAAGAIGGPALATAALTAIAGAVWDEHIATAHQNPYSAGEAIATIRQVSAGGLTINETTGVIEVYDPGGTLRLTLTNSYSAPTTTRTPS